jgi:hypothetical protein
MLPRLLANLVVLLHLAFIVFVVAGGFLAYRWPRAAWIHLPAAAWGALIELRGWICPLTPLENHLRHLAGEAGYTGGFIEHYVIPVVYPSGLTPRIQILLGIGVVAINGIAYGGYALRRFARRSAGEQ